MRTLIAIPCMDTLSAKFTQSLVIAGVKETNFLLQVKTVIGKLQVLIPVKSQLRC